MATKRRRKPRARRTTPVGSAATSGRVEAAARLPAIAGAAGLVLLLAALGLRCVPSATEHTGGVASAVVGTVGAGLVIASWLFRGRRG